MKLKLPLFFVIQQANSFMLSAYVSEMTIKPKITISSLDAIRLEKLMKTLPNSSLPGKDDLEAELAHAEVVDPKETTELFVAPAKAGAQFVDSSGFRLSPEWHIPSNLAVPWGDSVNCGDNEFNLRFRIESTSQDFYLTLVYPKDINVTSGTISILAPVGSTLLGLSQGNEIEWPKPYGKVLQVRIKEVTYQPERSGEYLR